MTASEPSVSSAAPSATGAWAMNANSPAAVMTTATANKMMPLKSDEPGRMSSRPLKDAADEQQGSSPAIVQAWYAECKTPHPSGHLIGHYGCANWGEPFVPDYKDTRSAHEQDHETTQTPALAPGSFGKTEPSRERKRALSRSVASWHGNRAACRARSSVACSCATIPPHNSPDEDAVAAICADAGGVAGGIRAGGAGVAAIHPLSPHAGTASLAHSSPVARRGTAAGGERLAHAAGMGAGAVGGALASCLWRLCLGA